MQDNLRQALQRLMGRALQQPVQIQQEKAMGGGCINHAMQLQTNCGTFFAKWNAQGPADLFLREAESLQALAEADTGLVIPEVYVATATTEELPALLVTSFLEPATSTSGQDEALGRGIAKLHRHTHQQYGFSHDNYCGATLQNNAWNTDWIAFFGEQRIWHLVKLIAAQGKFSSQDQTRYEQLIQKLPEYIGHRPAPALNHGDLWSGNYLYAFEGPALIDPASYYADREFDLALMAMFGGFTSAVWDAYQEAYPLPPEWKQRRDLYMLYHYLNHYYLFGGSYGQQAHQIAKSYT